MYTYYSKRKLMKAGLFFKKTHAVILLNILTETNFLNDEKIVLENFSKGAAKKILNASTPLWSYIPILKSFCSNIYVFRPWVSHLILFSDEPVVLDAFRSVLGHEKTHLENRDFSTKKVKKIRDRRFIHWVNEVHCDYNGLALAFNCDYEKSICAMRYIQRHKMISTGTDKTCFTHPSRALRTKYVEMKQFDRALIAEIAKDAGSDNQELIERVSAHFNNIITLR